MAVPTITFDVEMAILTLLRLTGSASKYYILSLVIMFHTVEKRILGILLVMALFNSSRVFGGVMRKTLLVSPISTCTCISDSIVASHVEPAYYT